MKDSKAELDSIFASDKPTILTIGKTKLEIRELTAQHFSLAMDFQLYIIHGFDANDGKGWLVLEASTGLSIAELKCLKLTSLMKIYNAILEVNNDFFTQLPRLAAQIEKQLAGRESLPA